MNRSETTLHYIIDPLCSWSYAALPLMQASQGLAGIDMKLHLGGMLTGHRVRQITPEWHDYVLPHDQRIAKLSGQPFGEVYFNKLLRDTSVTLDSTPPSIAILAAQSLGMDAIAILDQVQRLYYEKGQALTFAHLQQLATDLALPETQYEQACDNLTGEGLQHHFTATRALMERLQSAAYPTAALVIAGGLQQLPINQFYGQPKAWLSWLQDNVL